MPNRLARTPQDLVDAEAEILVLLSAIDETYEQTVHARSSYRADEIRWNARFTSIFMRTGANAQLSVDISRLHEIDTA